MLPSGLAYLDERQLDICHRYAPDLNMHGEEYHFRQLAVGGEDSVEAPSKYKKEVGGLRYVRKT